MRRSRCTPPRKRRALACKRWCTKASALASPGKLLPEVPDTVRLAHDHGVALSFGHLSPQEMDALGEEVSAIGYKRAFIDHPFSEVFQFDVPKLKRWASQGLHFVLTWDE